MPLQNHLVELERKHQALEREIQDALNHPSMDDIRLAELKRKKLQLKDQITRLKGTHAMVH
ncbi:YdcH family protein [Microvirga sp. 2TAF3]|uniref:YdcH family protein n=1 Tax=Microvirga sp. 2TAF3 TaxID=3233014 RepID=UPI003F9E81F0